MSLNCINKKQNKKHKQLVGSMISEESFENLPIQTPNPNEKKNSSITKKTNTNNNNNNKPCPTITINDNNQIRNIFVATNEVTFCNISDDDGENVIKTSRNVNNNDNNGSNYSFSATTTKNRCTVNMEDVDAESIMSSLPKTGIKPEIPDGGFGWVVVFASVMVSLIADGISFSFGLLYTEFLMYFGESKSKTAWIGSIFLAVPLLSGPIMSNLVDNYGCRRMTIIGGIISGIGFVLASISTSIEMLYWTFGVVGGLGLGIGYVTAVCSIVGWFDKKRTFATSIGASGTGLGTFLYAPFTQYLIESFGWRGACLILAGTMFNLCICGALMRDPDWLIESNRLDKLRSLSMVTFSNSSVCMDEIKKLLEDGAPNETVLEKLVTNVNTEVNQQLHDKEELPKKYLSLLLLPTYLSSPDDHDSVMLFNRYGSRRSLRKKPETKFILEANDLVTTTVTSPETINTPEQLLTDFNKKSLNNKIEYISSSCGSLKDEPVEKSPKYIKKNSLDELELHSYYNSGELQIENNSTNINISESTDNKPLGSNNRSVLKKKKSSIDDITYDNLNLRKNVTLKNSHYLQNMRIHRNSIHYRCALLNTHRYHLRASSCPNIYRNSMTTLARENENKWYNEFMNIIKSILDFSLFLNPKFAYFETSTLLLFTGFVVPYFYLPEQMLNNGYVEDDSAFLLSLMGVFNTVGMIGLGYVGDQPWINISKSYGWCLLFCGISIILMPICIASYESLCVLSALFGITFASSFSFTPMILVQLVSLDDFTCAYGLVLLIQGIGNLIGPPLAGLIYELTVEWNYAFYFGGFFISLAGIFVYITGILQDRDRNEENQSDNTDTDA